VHPAAGRLFGPFDREQPGEAPIVVLSHAYWTRRFDQDPAIVGRTLTLNGQPMTVVGVAAAGFRGMSILPPDVWVPAVMISTLDPENQLDFSPAARVAWQMMTGGRLKPGVSRQSASTEVSAIGEALEQEHEAVQASLSPDSIPPSGDHMIWYVAPASLIPAGMRIPAGSFLSVLMVLVTVVLIIACANLAGVLLARATVRRREMALRVAIGAARGRLVRQLLIETLVLFVLAGAAGLLVARAATSLLVRLLPEFPLPVNLHVPLDGRVALFAVSISCVAAICSGLAPALHASRTDVLLPLKDHAQGPYDRLRLRNAFVVTQVALSILLVLTAGLLVRGLDSVSSNDPGYDARGVDVASVDLSMGGYTNASGSTFARDLVERVRSLPGVRVATLADRAPGAGGLSLGGLTVSGVTPPDGQSYFFANWNLIESDYFRTLGIPLLAGRDVGSSDHSTAQRVAIVSESTALRLWPGKDAVGQTFFATQGGAESPTRVPFVVVGVVRDARPRGARGITPLTLYVPLQQRYSRALSIFARAHGDRRVVADLRSLVRTMNPNLPVLSAGSLEDQQNGPKETSLRVAAGVAGGVGAVGLVLAAIGIYGVTAYAVTQRTREIGIRLTLGAHRADVVVMVLRQGMTLVTVGSVIGLLCGGGAAIALSGSGIGTPPPDPSVFVGTAILFAVVGLIACYLPVRRVTRLGASEALRYE
jgi:predicted permease